MLAVLRVGRRFVFRFGVRMVNWSFAVSGRCDVAIVYFSCVGSCGCMVFDSTVEAVMPIGRLAKAGWGLQLRAKLAEAGWPNKAVGMQPAENDWAQPN